VSVSRPPETPTSPAPAPQAAIGGAVLAHSVLAACLGWLVPGLGHIVLRRFGRGIAFFLLVVTAIAAGYLLQGELYHPQAGKPLSKLGTLGAMGMGLPYFLLRFGMSYAGDLMGRGYEYGSAFLLTAGLMNWLLVLDVWDIGRGKKD
jgi:hypothetical protein